ncbi:MAG: hypothetical protein AAF533_17565 [Acidobacteriota bacterium]
MRRILVLLAGLSLGSLLACGGSSDETSPLIPGGGTGFVLERVGPTCLADDSLGWAVLLAEGGTGCTPGTQRQIWVTWAQDVSGVVTVPSLITSAADPTLAGLDCPSGGLCRTADAVEVDITGWIDGVGGSGTVTLTFGGFDTRYAFTSTWCPLTAPCG